MPDHLHLLTNQPKSSADVLRFVKGITARRVIDYLKEKGYRSSLAKLRHEKWKRRHSYSLWQQEKNVFSIFSEAVFMQKVNYIHINPVRAGISVFAAYFSIISYTATPGEYVQYKVTVTSSGGVTTRPAGSSPS